MTTRRSFLTSNLIAAAGLGAGLGRSSFAQTGHAGAPPSTQSASPFRDFWNDWADDLTLTMNRSREARKSTLAQIKSQAQAQARVEFIRTSLWELLGGPLERADLNARVTGTIEGGSGFKIEKLLYESVPGVVVTANLYLPTAGDRPYPAILAPVGHSNNGKAYHSYQHLYQNLARLGYVVLSYDPWGQGERLQYIDPATGQSRMEPTDEHSMAGRPMLLIGDSLAQYLTWDGIRGVDYLVSRPEVDPKRIGCTGQSGGGTMTMYLAALEPRIAAAVVNEGNTENVAGPHYDPPGAIDDAEQNVPGSLPLHLDRGDIIAAAAPRPLLICYTTHDRGETYSPVYDEASPEVYREAASLYLLLGAEEKIGISASHMPHGLDYTNRQHTYRWFNRWLKGHDDGPVTESEFKPYPDAMLNATRTGQVSTSIQGRTSVQVNRDRLSALLKTRRAQPAHTEQLRRSLTALLALKPATGTPSSQILSSTPQPGMTIEQFFFETELGVRTPGWFLRPTSVQRPPVLLHVADDSGTSLVKQGACDRLVEAGYAICSITLRGSGIAHPRFPRNGPNYYNPISLVDERYAWAWLTLGSPIAGQRVHDILRAIDYVSARTDVNVSQLRLLGRGSASIAAQMAAFFDTRIHSVFLENTLASFASVIDSPDYTLDLSWFVPGILRHMDLPDMLAGIAPRPCWIHNSVDATGAVLNKDALKDRLLAASNSSALPPNLHFVDNHAADPQDTYLDWLRST